MPDEYPQKTQPGGHPPPHASHKPFPKREGWREPLAQCLGQPVAIQPGRMAWPWRKGDRGSPDFTNAFQQSSFSREGYLFWGEGYFFEKTESYQCLLATLEQEWKPVGVFWWIRREAISESDSSVSLSALLQTQVTLQMEGRGSFHGWRMLALSSGPPTWQVRTEVVTWVTGRVPVPAAWKAAPGSRPTQGPPSRTALTAVPSWLPSSTELGSGLCSFLASGHKGRSGVLCVCISDSQLQRIRGSSASWGH